MKSVTSLSSCVASSGSATRPTRSTFVGAVGGRGPSCEVLARGYSRKLLAPLLHKDAEELVWGIFGKSFAGNFWVRARDMQRGCTGL